MSKMEELMLKIEELERKNEELRASGGGGGGRVLELREVLEKGFLEGKKYTTQELSDIMKISEKNVGSQICYLRKRIKSREKEGIWSIEGREVEGVLMDSKRRYKISFEREED